MTPVDGVGGVSPAHPASSVGASTNDRTASAAEMNQLLQEAVQQATDQAQEAIQSLQAFFSTPGSAGVNLEQLAAALLREGLL
jgi:hypothetical protein